MGKFYKNYLKLLAFLDSKLSMAFFGQDAALKWLASLGSMLPAAFHGRRSEEKIEDPDQKATDLGDRYRGIGVFVGILGVLIIFCAIAPVALQVGGNVAEIFGWTEIVLMVSLLGLVTYGSGSNLKSSWIAARREAELMRYQKLHKAIDDLKNRPDAAAYEEKADAELRSKLETELHSKLDEQYNYNKIKAHQYESIERFSNFAGWLGFFFALSAAVAHLWMHEAWLLFFTGFLPALVGGIHAINGFLGLTDLAEEHAEMAERLGHIRGTLKNQRSSNDLLELATITYETLTNRDVRWAEDAKRLGLKPA